MAVSMIGPKFYAWDRNGKPLAFGKLYTYQARTNEPKATYQSEDQIVENTNPVILNGEGYADVYLDGSYKMVLKDSDDNEIWSSDPVTANQAEEWVNCQTAEYVSPKSFRVSGNLVDVFDEERRCRVNNNTTEYAYSSVESSSFAGGFTTDTITDSVVTTGIVSVCPSIVGKGTLDYNAAQVTATDSTTPRRLDDRFADVVNVKDFGGAGDGVTDDTAAIKLADAEGSITLVDDHFISESYTFNNKVIFAGGSFILQSLSVELDFPHNDEMRPEYFGAKADAVRSGETVVGTDDYIPIQAALYACARTNGKMVFRAGGGQYRCDTGLVNTVPYGTCSIFGDGLLSFKLMTDKDITMLWLGGSAQAVKRVYVLFVNPTADLQNQVGVRFANDDVQWSQSVIEQVWVQNAQRSFVLGDHSTGPFGTIWLNKYKNLQSVSNRDWGFYFDSKNGSTTIHLDTCYVKGSVNDAAKGMYFRNIKDILLTNIAIDKCVNNALGVAAVNEFNAKNLALEGCSMTDGVQVLCNLNAASNHIDGFTSTVADIDVGAGEDGRILFFGSNAIAGNTVKGFVEIGNIETSGNFVKAAISSADTRVQILDDSVKLSETVDNGYVFGFGIKGQDFSRTGLSPDNSSLTGDRERGHVFWNAGDQVGQPKYWVNTTGGTNSTYVSGGDL